METIFGLLSLGLGGWQGWASVRYFRSLKTAAGKSASPFTLYALYFSFFFAFLLIILGGGLLLHQM